MLVLAVFAWTVLIIVLCPSIQGVDRTIEPEASGSDVVLAVVARIEAVFGSDKKFLRRIAYVESKDGTDQGTYRNGYDGGIWQVDQIGFQSTKDTNSHPGLRSKYETIKKNFGIDWTQVQWRDLRKPLYSGLAARLIIFNVPDAIPCDISGQAAYWKRHYNTEAGAGTVDKFTNDVNALENMQSCRVNTDLMFVLDSSGSIGESDFRQVKRFVLDFVSELRIGPNDNQVGVISFGDNAHLNFGLSRYRERDSLRQAVNSIVYLDESTNIPDALCKLISAYSGNAGARTGSNSVFRLAILMTDGQSNTNENSCGFSSVADATQAVHAVRPPILLFGYGVGSNFSPQELAAIASGPEFISTSLSFDSSQVACVQSEQSDKICNKVSTPIAFEDNSQGSLQQDEQVRLQYDIPESGATFELSVEQGTIVFYASTMITSPNEAFHEWKAQTSDSTSVYIKPTPAATGQNEKSLNTDLFRSQDTNVTIQLYVAMLGLDANNTFTLKTTAGSKSGTTSSSIVILEVMFVSTLLSLATIAF